MVQIETSKKKYETKSISMRETKTSKGLYFINDAEGKGIYANEDLEIVKQIYAFALEKAKKNEIINTKELKKQEYEIINPKERENNKNEPENSASQEIEKDWKKIENELQQHIDISEKIIKERDELVKTIKQMQENEAPEELQLMAKRILELADKGAAREKEPTDTAFEVDEPPCSSDNEKSYVMYKLENKLLTRANAAFKAGIMNAYEKLISPFRYLHEKALTIELESAQKELKKRQYALDKYKDKIEKKLGARIEKANAKRRKMGLEPFPPNTALYYPKEQERINSYNLLLNYASGNVEDIQHELDYCHEKHQSTIYYIKDLKAISKNEKIAENHKKIFYQKEAVVNPSDVFISNDSLNPDAPASNLKETKQNEIHQENTEQNNEKTEDDMIVIPVYGPDGEQIGEQKISHEEVSQMGEQDSFYQQEMPDYESYPKNEIPKDNNNESLVPDANDTQKEDPSLFSPVSERFSSAKTEASNSKELTNAIRLYFVIESKLPLNAMIEFEANGDAFIAQRSEYGELTMQKYSYENSNYEEISKNDTINIFKKNPVSFENAIRAQLGEVLIGKPKEKDMEIPDK